MSAALDVRKCLALASLFACGQSGGVRVAHKYAPCNTVARKSRCPQKKEKARKVRAYLFVVRSTQNKWCCRTGALHLTLRVLFVCYVRCARHRQMLRVCLSLRLRSTETCSTAIVTEGQSRATDGARPNNASIVACKLNNLQGEFKFGVRRKKKKHEKFVLIFLWCGHRDLNSDGVTIRPSNVRVCLFRHDRLTLPII